MAANKPKGSFRLNPADGERLNLTFNGPEYALKRFLGGELTARFARFAPIVHRKAQGMYTKNRALCDGGAIQAQYGKHCLAAAG